MNKSLPSVMGHSFAKVPQVSIERSTFDRSFGIKTTFDAGYLVPIFVDEALPGDTFNVRLNCFARLATPIKPVMDNMFLDTFFFAVPIRLLWANWEKFNGAQTNPGDSTAFTVPTIPMPATGPEVGTLSDYLGLPTDIANSYSVSAFWHRAYNLIWNTWFRDENLQNSVVVDTDDGPDTYTDYVLKRRGKRHDYFTSSLPWPQKGTAVSLPLGTSATVKLFTGSPGLEPLAKDSTTFALFGATTWGNDALGQFAAGGGGGAKGTIDPNGTLWADLATATAASINSIREAFQLQQLLERDARGGTRYVEIIKSHFGVTCPDFRLQRPEYLGGGSSPINIHPVPQTTISGTTPQGNLAAFGTASAQGHGFNKSFVEHCVLIGLANVRADLTYQQGVPRMFSRSTRYDFYWPSLAHLGEQAVLNKEIYVQGTAADTTAFGYQERHAEYRYKPSLITGAFRSTYATTLDYWHLSQKFTALPTLGDTFIQDDPPVDRVIAVPAEPHLLFDGYFKMVCARPMPLFGVPGWGPRL